MDSICRFVPPSRTGESIQTVNFVYETRHSQLPPAPHRAVYAVHLVTAGSALIVQGGREERVGPGSLFFLFPAVESTVTGDENFRYLYVSFFGIRAAFELERLGIGPACFVFSATERLTAFWQAALDMGQASVALASESVVLFTLACIAASRKESDDAVLPGAENARLLKEYLDKHFTDPALSADRLSKVFSYHKKYISALFKKHYRLSVVEYLRAVRLTHACQLLENGRLSVKEVAESAGFQDPLYFSRVFKRAVGLSPSDFRAEKIKKER